MEHNKIQAAIKSPQLIDSTLEPLELPVFDPKLIEGLKFVEQQMVRSKFLNEQHQIKVENNRRKEMREQIRLNGLEVLSNEMARIKHERANGIFPSKLVDASLSQNLIDANSPFRKYAQNKFAFEQAALSPFMHLKSQSLNDISENDKAFNTLLDSTLDVLKKGFRKMSKNPSFASPKQRNCCFSVTEAQLQQARQQVENSHSLKQSLMQKLRDKDNEVQTVTKQKEADCDYEVATAKVAEYKAYILGVYNKTHPEKPLDDYSQIPNIKYKGPPIPVRRVVTPSSPKSPRSLRRTVTNISDVNQISAASIHTLAEE